MEIFELFNKHKDIEDLIKITAIENAINGIAFADLNAKLFYVNNAFINFFGYESKDQVIGESALNFWVNPEDAKKVIEVISINNCWSGTLIGRKKNGESFDILLNANLLKDNNGKPICMQAVFIDISSQKKIEKELLEKNAFLSNIIDNIPLMIFIKEAKNLKFVKCNKSGEKLLNYKEADLLGKNDYDFFPKEQADFFTGIDKEVLTKKKHFIIEEEPINTPNGVKFLHTQKIPLYNDKGEPIYLLGISEDITARKKAEEKIKEQENFLIKLMEGIPIPIFYKDIEGRYQLFNKAFEDFFGKKKEELIGKNVFDINPPELAKIYHAKDVELFEKPGTQIYESKVKDAQGQIHDVIFHKATILNSDGQPSGLIGAIMDITEKNKMTQELNAAYQQLLANEQQLKATNQQLLANEQQLKAKNQHLTAAEQQLKALNEILKNNLKKIELAKESAEMEIYEWDIKTNELSPGTYIKKIYALDLKTFDDFINIVFPEDKQKVLDTLKNAIETKKAFNKLDFRIVMPNGNIRWIRSSGALIFDDNNNLIKIIKTSLDITDQKLLQEQLIHSEKLSAVGQLTAGVAHEFNNLLTIIYNTALLMELEENKPLPNLIKIIYDTVKRGADIVSNMMAFAKPSAPKRELTKIENIIDKVLKLQEQQLFLENIEIEKRYNNTNDVLIDTGQFQQVFLNIIINARHAIIPKEKGKIIISTETRDNNVLIKISDNGIGIAPENIDKIFNPFFTTKGAYSQDDLGIKGSGLGLSVTQTIIQNHNGAISVESKKDAGSTFIITLPLPEKEFEKKIIESSKKTISEKNGNKKLKVLIVDDEQFILNSMTRILKLHNCEVYSALTGAEALNLAQKTKLDVIFLDMLLPQMTGEKILKEIKKIDYQVPIVFISGQIGLELEKINALGAYAFIQKPFYIEDVTKILTQISENK